jgi:DNA invertase Pin-like site-specific DNA recombinase
MWRSLPPGDQQFITTVEDLEARGLGFRSLTESIDTTTSGGRLIFHIFASLAEFERSVIRERTKAGLQTAYARGRLGGRPPALSREDLAAAKALLRDPAITVEQVAKRLGVAPSTASTGICRVAAAPSSRASGDLKLEMRRRIPGLAPGA